MQNVSPHQKSLSAALLAALILASCAKTKDKDSYESALECGAFYLSYSMFLGQEDEEANRKAEQIGEIIRAHRDYSPDKLVGQVDDLKFANAAYALLYDDGVFSVNPLLAEAAPDIVPDEERIAEANEIESFCDELLEEKSS